MHCCILFIVGKGIMYALSCQHAIFCFLRIRDVVAAAAVLDVVVVVATKMVMGSVRVRVRASLGLVVV